MSIDRVIIMSMTLSNSFWKKLFTSFPRIILATIIGITISKPIEIAIFSDEIDKIINQNRIKKIEEIEIIHQKNITKLSTEYSSLTNTIHTQVKNIEESYTNSIWNDKKDKIKADLKVLKIDLANEYAGKGRKGIKISGPGPNTREYEKQIESKEAELEKTYERINSLEENNDNGALDARTKHFEHIDRIAKEYSKDKETLNSEREAKLNRIKELHTTSFISRYKVMGELIEKSEYMKNINLFIMLLFIFIELSPILSKLLYPKGPYDVFIEDEYTLATEKYSLYKESIQNKYQFEFSILNKLYSLLKKKIKKKNKIFDNYAARYYSRIFENDILQSAPLVFKNTPDSRKDTPINRKTRITHVIITSILIGCGIYWLYIQGYDLIEASRYILGFSILLIVFYTIIIKYLDSGKIDLSQLNKFKG